MTGFAAFHVPGRPLLMPNAWDAGSARLLASLGFAALGTTSSGYAASLGRPDYAVVREEALAHAAHIARAVDVPVSADLEDGFGPSPAQVAATVTEALGTGLAGCSIEDSTRDPDRPIHPFDHAVERVAAAVAAAGGRLVVTARAENLLHGRDDLDDTVARLQAYAATGADVVYAPGLRRAQDIARVVEAVAPKPVNVLAVEGAPPVGELAALGVARISVGGAFAFAAYAAAADAARELLEDGTFAFTARARAGTAAIRRAARGG